MDYPDASFEIAFADGSVYSESNFPNKLAIRVFNTDFIADNLKWNEDKDEVNPIFLLGTINIELQKELADERAKLLKAKNDLKTLADNKQNEEIRIASGLTNKAREIKNELSLPNFTKVHFEPDVSKVVMPNITNLLSPESVQKLIATYKSTDKRDNIALLTVLIPNVNQISTTTHNVLKTTVTAKIIERLRNNPELNEWVKVGKGLHIDQEKCQFCGNTLPADLLSNLGAHFSQDYEDLLSNIGNQISKNRNTILRIPLPDSANFYSEIQAEYIKAKRIIEDEMKKLNVNIEQANELLEKKKFQAFEAITETISPYDTTILREEIIKVNEIIGRHNGKTAAFDKARSDSYKKLIQNYALGFSLSEKYAQTQKTIKDLDSEVIKVNGLIRQIDIKIVKLEEQLSETVKGAEKINEYLKLYFGKQDVKVRVTCRS